MGESMQKLIEIVEELKKYRSTGLTPEQIIEMDKMYREKCKELAELRREVYGHTE